MENKNFIRKIGMLEIISLLILNPYAYQIAQCEEDSFIIQVVKNMQQAVRNKDKEKIWELSGKIKRRFHNNDFDEFKRKFDIWCNKVPDVVQVLINAPTGEVKIISQNRAWVAYGPGEKSKGFYIVKENNEWKYGEINNYITAVLEDIMLLNKAIKNYYTDKQHFPNHLSALTPTYIDDIPFDIFSDKKSNYGYKAIGKKSWKIYSIGVDGRDDFGLVEYKLNLTSDSDAFRSKFGSGDIIIESNIN